MQSSIFLCLSQARINWKGCDRKGIRRKNGGGVGGSESVISPDGVVPTQIVGVSASCFLLTSAHQGGAVVVLVRHLSVDRLGDGRQLR